MNDSVATLKMRRIEQVDLSNRPIMGRWDEAFQGFRRFVRIPVCFFAGAGVCL